MKKLSIVIFLLLSFKLKAQVNNINSIFNQPNYSFFSPDSNNYILNGVDSYNTLIKQIDSLCPFNINEFYGDLSKINVDTTQQLMYGLHNQVPNHDSLYTECKFKFSLNNKESYWYAFYKKSVLNNENAFLFIPGSGPFQSLKIAQGDLTNYHNLNGNNRIKCLQYGDFYVYNKLNEEFRSFWRMITPTNYKRLDYDFLTPYTDNKGNHWAANMHIELVAAVKTLKKKYKRVFIMGLSSGGFPALLAGILGEADGINCAAGISSWSYNGFLTPTIDQTYFANIFNYYSFDSISKLIQNSPSRFLFSYGTGDGGGNAFENQTKSIEDSINSDCNTDYFYNFFGHTFPTVYYDTFITKVIKTPKVNLTNAFPLNCLADTLMLKLDFTGNPPYNFSFFKDNVLLQNYTTNNNTVLIPLTNEGKYFVKNLTDVNNVPLCKSKEFEYIKKKKPSYTLTKNGYLCNQKLDSITLNTNGIFPLTLQIIDNAVLNNIVLTDSVVGFKKTNGVMIFNSISDTNNCIITMNDTVKTVIDTFYANIDSNYYNCFTNSNIIHFNLKGKKPFKINFNNGSSNSILTTTDTSFNYSPTNGNYFITTISDSNNCKKTANQAIQFNNNPLNYIITNAIYVCDSNKSKIEIELTGNPPFLIYYRKNGIQNSINTTSFNNKLYFDNGNYIFDSIKDATCIKNINQPININYDSLAYSIGIPTYNCDSNKTSIHFELQGNLPWTIHYHENNIAKQKITTDSSFDYLFTNGQYSFNFIQDATCFKNINQQFYFDYDSLSFSISNPVYVCDSNKSKIEIELTGNPPFLIYYRKNGIQNSINTTSFNNKFYFDNGNYIFDSIKDATCIKNITPLFFQSFNYTPFSATIMPPQYDCDSEKVKVNFVVNGSFPIKIYYRTIGSTIVNNVSNTFQNSHSIYFSNGTHVIDSIVDNTNCKTIFNTIVNNNFQNLAFQKNQTTYNCDSAKSNVSYSIQGTPPYSVNYTNLTTNTNYQYSFSTSSFNLLLNNGNYVIQSITDSKCTKLINDTLSLFVSQLQSNVTEAAVSCDSNKVYVVLNSPYGVRPYTYTFYQNNILRIFNSYNLIDTLYLANGNYFFDKITDSLGCELNYNKTIVANYIPFQYENFVTKYNCIKDSTWVTFNVNHLNPLQFYYQNNNTLKNDSIKIVYPLKSFHFPNGSYTFLNIKDSLGCVQLINNLVEINNVPISVSNLEIEKNCVEKLYTYQMELSGKAPYKLEYIKENSLLQETFNTNSVSWNIQPNLYNLISISDSNSCQVDINKKDTLHSFYNQDLLLTYENSFLNSQKTKFKNNWYKNDTLIENENKNVLRPYGSGIYKTSIEDEAGCIHFSNNIVVKFPNEINVYPNPVLNTLYIAVNSPIKSEWRYSIYDIYGNIIRKNEVNIPFHEIDVQLLSKGIYQIKIMFENELRTFRFTKL